MSESLKDKLARIDEVCATQTLPSWEEEKEEEYDNDGSEEVKGQENSSTTPNIVNLNRMQFINPLPSSISQDRSANEALAALPVLNSGTATPTSLSSNTYATIQLEKTMDSEDDKSFLLGEDSFVSQVNPHRVKATRNVYAVSLKKQPFAVNRKDLVLEVARDMFARQKWSTFKEMTTKLLLPDTRVPGFMLMKHFFLMLYAEDARHIDTHELRNFIKQFMFLLDNQKYEFLLELAIYILRNDQLLLSEKPFLIDLRTEMEKRTRRSNWSKSQLMLRQTYELYEEYLEFIEWKAQNDPRNFATYSVHSSLNTSSYMSSVLEHLSKKIKANLNRLLSNNEHVEMNLDIGVLMLLQLYDNDNELIEALDLLEQYAMRNPDHLNAHIYLYEFLTKFPDIPHDYKIRIFALQNIVRLCPDSRYTLLLVKEQPVISGLTVTERLQMLVDFVDYKQNQRSKKTWKLIHKSLAEFINESGEDMASVQQVQLFFSDRLLYWERIHYKLADLQSVLQKLRQYQQSRSHPDYSSDISTASESSIGFGSFPYNLQYSKAGSSQQAPSSDGAISKYEYYLYIYKGRVLHQLSQLELPLSPNLEQYKEIMAPLLFCNVK